MAYNHTNLSERGPNDPLLPEEQEVLDALSGYLLTDDRDYRSFTPSKALYRTYRDYIAGMEYRNPCTETLSQPAFGAVVRFLFDLNTRYVTPRVYRRVDGVLTGGYLGMSGPATVQTRNRRGRPRRGK